MPQDRTVRTLLVSCAAVEAVVFGWLCSLPRARFLASIWTPDSPGYVRVAERLGADGTLIAGPRTLGYPLFLAANYRVVGKDYWLYSAIGVQLLLNLILTWGTWKLLARLAPTSPRFLRTAATAFVFYAGLGMALYVMTDFMAGVFFAIFFYALMFWRRPGLTAVGGASLLFATLTRPTFTFLPLLLPAICYLAGRVTTRVSVGQMIAFLACSVAATSISVEYQYRYYGYLGPSPFLVIPIEETLYNGIVKHQPDPVDFVTYKHQFEAQIETRAGHPYASLLPGEQERIAKTLFREQLAAHPGRIAVNLFTNFLKYLFVPVEAAVIQVTRFSVSEQTYATFVRPLLAMLCLPVWIAALLPPSKSNNQRFLYAAVILLVGYVLGASSIGQGSGERIRFPLLVWMMPIAVWNGAEFRRSVPRWRRTRSSLREDIAGAGAIEQP